MTVSVIVPSFLRNLKKKEKIPISRHVDDQWFIHLSIVQRYACTHSVLCPKNTVRLLCRHAGKVQGCQYERTMHVVSIGTHMTRGSVLPNGRMATATWLEGLSWEVLLPRTAVQRLVVFDQPSLHH